MLQVKRPLHRFLHLFRQPLPKPRVLLEISTPFKNRPNVNAAADPLASVLDGDGEREIVACFSVFVLE